MPIIDNWINEDKSKFLYNLLLTEIPWKRDGIEYDHIYFSSITEVLFENYYWGPYPEEEDEEEQEEQEEEPLMIITVLLRQLATRIFNETQKNFNTVMIKKCEGMCDNEDNKDKVMILLTYDEPSKLVIYNKSVDYNLYGINLIYFNN